MMHEARIAATHSSALRRISPVSSLCNPYTITRPEIIRFRKPTVDGPIGGWTIPVREKGSVHRLRWGTLRDAPTGQRGGDAALTFVVVSPHYAPDIPIHTSQPCRPRVNQSWTGTQVASGTVGTYERCRCDMRPSHPSAIKATARICHFRLSGHAMICEWLCTG